MVLATDTDNGVDVAFSWLDVATTMVSDLPGFGCKPFCVYCLPYVSGTGSENSETLSSVVGVHGRMELCVVSVLVVLDAMLRDDITHWAAVDSIQQWAQH